MNPMTIAVALGVAGIAVTGTLAASVSVTLAAFNATRSIDSERDFTQDNKDFRTASPLAYYAVQSH